MGLVVQSCHFDVTACAEARRLAQRAERPRAGWIKMLVVVMMMMTMLIIRLGLLYHLTLFHNEAEQFIPAKHRMPMVI